MVCDKPFFLFVRLDNDPSITVRSRYFSHRINFCAPSSWKGQLIVLGWHKHSPNTLFTPRNALEAFHSQWHWQFSNVLANVRPFVRFWYRATRGPVVPMCFLFTFLSRMPRCWRCTPLWFPFPSGEITVRLLNQWLVWWKWDYQAEPKIQSFFLRLQDSFWTEYSPERGAHRWTWETFSSFVWMSLSKNWDIGWYGCDKVR